VRAALVALLFAGCVDTTGGAIVTFHAAAAGPADATGGPLEGDTSESYHLVVTTAKLHIGAAYLRITNPGSGAAAQPCIGASQDYAGEVLTSLDVDLLSSDPQPFAGDGEGTASLSAVGEIWLVGTTLDDTKDSTPVVQLAGTASKDGMSYPFTATVTITSQNRPRGTPSAAQPGLFPICNQKIVALIPTNFTPTEGGTLLVRVDPRLLLDLVQFADIPADPMHPGTFPIPDNNNDQQGASLFSNIHSTPPYKLTFDAGQAP
jgi:hypothetical protein